MFHERGSQSPSLLVRRETETWTQASRHGDLRRVPLPSGHGGQLSGTSPLHIAVAARSALPVCRQERFLESVRRFSVEQSQPPPERDRSRIRCARCEALRFREVHRSGGPESPGAEDQRVTPQPESFGSFAFLSRSQLSDRFSGTMDAVRTSRDFSESPLAPRNC